MKPSAEPPPADCRILRGSGIVRVSRVVIEGLRLQQRLRSPDVEELLDVIDAADLWLASTIYDANRMRRLVLTWQ